MNLPRLDYKPILTGGVITISLTILLSGPDFYIINPAYVSSTVYVAVNILSFLVCWLVFSFLSNKYPIYKVVGIVALLMGAALTNHFLEIFNPLTVPLIILFWVGITYLILPQFFKKYKIAILSVYGFVLSYFLIFRMSPNYLESYHQNFLNFMLVPIPVFTALWIYEQWRWLKNLEADKTTAELTLLKSQINPHFFFNTLNNLYGLAVEKSDQAPAMILKLSDMMRYTIYDGKADYVPLQNEVGYLEDYIELNKIRYQREVTITFQKELSHSHEIAPLLLIVLLENAFKHGVESMAEQAFIHIKITTTSTSIFFQISNNYEPNEKTHTGIGLENLKQRLALIYPNKHHLEISKTADTYAVNLEIR